MCVVGGGIVGMEFAPMFVGSDDVTVVEMAPNIVPSCDVEAAKELAKAIKAKRKD